MASDDSVLFLSASSGNNNNNNITINNAASTNATKINTKSPVLWKVRHTISAANPSAIPMNSIIKSFCVFLCLIVTIIGSVVACITSHRVSPFYPSPPNGPVDGKWSAWSPWTSCSITCSNSEQRFGLMKRLRHCNTPPPQLKGKNCSGNSMETTSCFNKPCPRPINGNWSQWSEWSACSKTCKEHSSAPLQLRSRSCTNPSPLHGGTNCIGESRNQRFCEWLPYCPIDGRWGNWYIAGPCESRDKKTCALGSQRHQRQCNNPSPNTYGKGCEGIKEKIEDCWFLIGCPVDLQPPLNLQVIGNKTGLFNVSWSSVPYGKPAVLYRIYKTIEDSSNKEIDTFYEDITATPTQEVTGKDYWHVIDMRRYNSSELFKTLAVRMSSIDFWKKESFLTDPERSGAQSVDGEWGEWGHWSDCSTKCNNQRGYRSRIRYCDDPRPSDGGKPCIGSTEENASCMGMEENC